MMENKKQKIDTMQDSREAVMDNKELILKSALDLFYAKGYDAVGVQEIVDKAGISKPTLYYYFGSKLGLLQNLLEAGYQEFESRLLDIAKPGESLPGCFIRQHVPFLTMRRPTRNSIYSCCLCFIPAGKMKPIKRFHHLLSGIIRSLLRFLRMRPPNWETCGGGRNYLPWDLQVCSTIIL